MSSVSTHVVVDEDLFDAAHQEAEKREITFSELYRRGLKAEIKYPSLITEIRELRQRVDKIENILADAVEAFDADIRDIDDFLNESVEKNFDLIEDVVDLIKKHVKGENL